MIRSSSTARLQSRYCVAIRSTNRLDSTTHRHFGSAATTSVSSSSISSTSSIPQSSFHDSIFPPVISPRCRFVHGDSTDSKTYAALFPEYHVRLKQENKQQAHSQPQSHHSLQPPIDVVLTDPPYCLLTPRHSKSDASTTAATSPAPDSYLGTSSNRQVTSRKKLLYDETNAASLRFSSTNAYTEYTRSWLLALRPYLSPQARVIIFTNYLGRSPIISAVKSVLPSMQLWNEMAWIKPAGVEKVREDDGRVSKKKRNVIVQHQIQLMSTNADAAQSLQQHSDASFQQHLQQLPPFPRYPDGRVYIPSSPNSSPSSFHLTSNELTYRCYEIALVFGVGKLSDSEYAGKEITQYVVAPYSEEEWGGDFNVASTSASRQSSSTSSPSSSASPPPPSASSLLSHPNAKPARVLLPLLNMYSRSSQLVMDPFNGSSSIALTSLRAGRRTASIEINEVWTREMQRRLTPYVE